MWQCSQYSQRINNHPIEIASHRMADKRNKKNNQQSGLVRQPDAITYHVILALRPRLPHLNAIVAKWGLLRLKASLSPRSWIQLLLTRTYTLICGRRHLELTGQKGDLQRSRPDNERARTSCPPKIHPTQRSAWKKSTRQSYFASHKLHNEFTQLKGPSRNNGINFYLSSFLCWY